MILAVTWEKNAPVKMHGNCFYLEKLSFEYAKTVNDRKAEGTKSIALSKLRLVSIEMQQWKHFV